MNEHFATLATPFQAWIPLEDLLHDFPLGLVLIAGVGDDAGARPVQWVHPSDLVEPAPFLTPRTVLLTTGSQFAGTLSHTAAATYVRSLVDAGAAALGIGVGIRWDRVPPSLVRACDEFRLPLIRVPYDTPFIAVSRAAQRLIDAAMYARSLDRSESLSRAQRTAPRLAGAEAALRTAVMRLLFAHHDELATDIASEVLPPLPKGQMVVLSLDLRDDAARPPLSQGIDGVIFGALDDRTLIICETSRLGPIRRLLDRHRIPAGLSERGDRHDLPTLLEQANRALEHALTINEPSIIEYRPAMHSGVLQLLSDSPAAKRRASGLLSPITRYDARHRDSLLESLTVWLSQNGQLSPAAAQLGVHRHTLRARIRTAAALIQRDMDSPDTRAELWTALRITKQRETDPIPLPAAHGRRA